MSLPSIRHQGLPPYHSGLPGHWGLSTRISSHTAPGHPSLPLHEAASSRPPQRPAGSSPGTPSLPESHAAPGHSLQDTSWPDLADARKVPVRGGPALPRVKPTSPLGASAPSETPPHFSGSQSRPIPPSLSEALRPFGLRAPGNNVAALPCLLYTSDAADDLLCVDLGG